MQLSGKSAKALAVLIALLSASAVWWAAKLWTQNDALTRLTQDTILIARQQTRLVDSELAKFRLLPVVLKEYSDLQDVLSAGSPDPTKRLNGKLELLARQVGSPIIYVIARDGTAIASSNAGTPESFVGRNYSFRPYFQAAVRHGVAEYYAIGDVTGRFGLFLARRIGDEADPVGVVVIKFEFHRLVQSWSNDPGQTFVIDPRGIILASTDKAEDLRSFQPISAAERTKIIGSGQFTAGNLEPSHYAFEPGGKMRGPDGRQFVAVSEPIAGTELKLVHIAATAPAIRTANDLARLITVAAMALLACLTAALYWRITRAARATADRAALEAAVASRTAELHAEMAERARADKRFREAREELAQANRLASLGSITAGLVHEINQPVATIRTLSENARHHLEKGKLDKVAANLSASVELTARIGSITQEMRRFAGRRRGEIKSIALSELIEGTLLLMGDRFRNANVRLDLPAPSGLHLMASRVRLEQVLVNLLQNALDAVADRSDPHVALLVSETGDHVSLIVADNGPGIDPELGEEIFNPFVTGKPEGLGLGLGIARDIMTELEGSLTIVPSPLGGAAFAATVKRAEREANHGGK
ncbi:two-component sensor histidine kinase [Brucella endophytica]|uniref:histidine kinase n=1 Tax=Brucella endophytica TaxID=1963359 RepID=A0A916S8W9_9HYPH|nr:ATP-binding protein [Brucella endophytica]GGA86655.1 two-component sensor histidine kinase [Brucella endophytica]